MAMKPESGMEQDPQLAALYRSGADVEPPTHLDDAIRAAARREVAAGPRRAGIRRWTVPVSLAAVLVLSVSVVTLMREQGMDRPESMLEPAPAPPAMTTERGLPAPAEPEALPKRRAVAPPPVTAPDAPVVKPAPSAPLSDRAAEAEQTEPESESRAKAATAAPGRAGDATAVRREYAAPQPLLRPAPAPMADAAVGASAAKPAAPAALAGKPGKNALWQDLDKEPPEKWLQRIAELRRGGKTEDASVVLAEFRRRFPDVRLPEDLLR